MPIECLLVVNTLNARGSRRVRCGSPQITMTYQMNEDDTMTTSLHLTLVTPRFITTTNAASPYCKTINCPIKNYISTNNNICTNTTSATAYISQNGFIRLSDPSG